MRFRTAHLLMFVFMAAFVCTLCRHPEALWAVVVPMIGGIFVVLPVLGTVELLGGRDSFRPQPGWGGVCLSCFIGAVGSVCAIVVLFELLDIFR
jgi:hypothetical protein